MAIIATRTVWTPPDRVTDGDLLDAAARIERLNLDVERQSMLAVDVLRAALGWVNFPGRPNPPIGTRLLGYELTDRGLRFGLESRYRTLARLAGTAADRVRLVDLANSGTTRYPHLTQPATEEMVTRRPCQGPNRRID